MTSRPFLTVQEFAELIGVNVPVVYKMCRLGKIPYMRVGTGKVGIIRIHRDVVRLLTEKALTERPTGHGRGARNGNHFARNKAKQLDLFPADDTPKAE
jgi:excisionase family DNA binding protein